MAFLSQSKHERNVLKVVLNRAQGQGTKACTALRQSLLKTAQLLAFYAVAVFDFQEAKYSKCSPKKHDILSMKLHVIFKQSRRLLDCL